MMCFEPCLTPLCLLFLALFISDHLVLGCKVEVTAHTATYIGLINGTTPHVRQFLNVPFALPPVGPRRWLPAEAPTSNSSTIVDSTTYPQLCPQYIAGSPNAFNQVLPGYLIPTGLNTSSPASMPPTTAEDCLSLAIWTPTGDVSGLPVIIFMSGGGFIIGGIDIPYQLPHHWVERTRSHIVVSINYRVGIMGFPNARGLNSQNLGISDQRLPHEWVRDNIEAFGGDPNKITLWGQSAGAMSTDFHTFAFYNDSIFKGLVMQSGTAFLPLRSYDSMGKKFSFVASYLGCGDLNATAELDCMRQRRVEDIVNFVGRYSDNGTLPALSFVPMPNEKLIFSNYTERYSKGMVATIPAIVGTASDEGTSLVPFIESGVNQTLVDLTTNLYFLCPAYTTSYNRLRLGLQTYRYQYAGNFSNLSPLPWLGAYHSSDLPMFFGTYADFSTEVPSSESYTSEIIGKYLLSFMIDPHDGPRRKGWPLYAEDQALRFGVDGIPVERFAVNTLEEICSESGLA